MNRIRVHINCGTFRIPTYEYAFNRCIGRWAGHMADLDGCGKPHPYRDSTPGPSSPKQVATQTALSRPTN
jgi:hypothetical protein